MYTTPLNKKANLIPSGALIAESNKPVAFNTYLRLDADIVVAPYGSTVNAFPIIGVDGEISLPDVISGTVPPLTDVWFAAQATTGTAGVTSLFFLLEQNA